MNSKNLSVEMVNPERLSPNPWNTNTVPPDNETKLEESIKRFGMFKPIIVREVDGKLQIIGGEHRASAAKRLKLKEVPIVNLGVIDDKRAKEIGLVDNGRYGSDDLLSLAELIEGLGSIDEITSYMPYAEADLASIFASTSIELDDLDLPDENDEPTKLPSEKPIQTHQIMRFKIPVGDAGMVTDLINRVMKTQKFTEGDSLENAGDAVVFICKNSKL